MRLELKEMLSTGGVNVGVTSRVMLFKTLEMDGPHQRECRGDRVEPRGTPTVRGGKACGGD